MPTQPDPIEIVTEEPIAREEPTYDLQLEDDIRTSLVELFEMLGDVPRGMAYFMVMCPIVTQKLRNYSALTKSELLFIDTIDYIIDTHQDIERLRADSRFNALNVVANMACNHYLAITGQPLLNMVRIHFN